MSSALERFSPATRDWFQRAFVAPTPVQERGWQAIGRGSHTLLLAPTGSGKTLAAFLWCLDALVTAGPPADDAPKGFRVLYISPLKALAADIERNLRAPLAGIVSAVEVGGQEPHIPRVQLRTGDTLQRVRQAMVRRPGDILVTTPESLFLMLSSGAREVLRTVETVIIDEIHAVAGSKRGVHLALSLERLSVLCTQEPQRIGLSATQRPLEEIASFLGGDRPVEIVDAGEHPNLDLEVIVPVEDMEAPDLPVRPSKPSPRVLDLGAAWEGEEGPLVPRELTTTIGGSSGNDSGIWPAVHPRILELVRSHRSTIIFTNSRRLCERLAQRLNELATEDGGSPVAQAHHGSISHEQRAVVEEQLKAGTLPCIVATASLELGIDMGAVDLVILVESPPSVASGLQRAGRAGHGVGQRSQARIFPKYRGDLLDAAVLVQRMREGLVESTRVPRNCLDVLAQQIVGMCVARPWQLQELEACVRRAWPYRELSHDLLLAVLDMLCGRLPEQPTQEPEAQSFDVDRVMGDLRPRLTWDRSTDTLVARRDARMVLYANAGTIPDRGLYGVFHADSGSRVGELDEEMVHELRRGDVILLGASSWRVTDLARDRVLVQPAPGQPGRMPFWRGEGPGRPVELGRARGAFVRELGLKEPGEASTWLQEVVRLDAWAAGNLLAYLAEQRAATGVLPTDRTIVIERFRDELGDWRVCLLTPFGARVHAPWALAIEARLSERTGAELDVMWTDDGIVLRLPDEAELPGFVGAFDVEALVPLPEEVEELVLGQLRLSPVYAARFREAAARSLMIARRKPGQRTPLWAQRLKAAELLAATRGWADFPVALEAYREVLQDVFDMPALVELLGQVQSRELRLHEVETPSPSPFARSLVFAFVATWVYEGDAPLAERRAQALSLDRHLLRELLGQEELRELLDAEVMDEVELELQRKAAHRQARSADGLHDVLRVLGHLDEAGVLARCEGDGAAAWLAELKTSRRALEVRVAGGPHWIAIEDMARYRDGLGVVPPGGVPEVFLGASVRPLEALMLRWARTHAPFTTTQIAAAFGLLPAQVEVVLRALVGEGHLLQGAFRPGREGEEWCDAEVLRRVKRRTLARLRGQVAPVDGPVLARFLVGWQGVLVPGERSRGGADRLWDVLVQLEGYPVSFAELEGRILPARVPGYRPDMLDQLGAAGEILWVGRGSLGSRDGKVALVRRERVAELASMPEDWSPEDAVQAAVLAHLLERGACFGSELHRGLQAAHPELGLEEVLAATWVLAWAGLVTNDTFHPLRGLASPRRKRAESTSRRATWRRGLGSGAGARPTLGGRWSALGPLLEDPAGATRRALSHTVMLAERYGVVGRSAARSEGIPGGFGLVYPVFREMEETGRMRRGWFVDGVEGAQFAVPGAVDRLRAAEGDQDPVVVALSAVDPANPYGALIDWPEPRGQALPRRASGAVVVLVDGRPVLFLEKGGKSLVTFDAFDEPRAAASAVEALRRMGRDRRSIHLERVDGAPAREAWEGLEDLGFKRDHRGLVLTAPL